MFNRTVRLRRPEPPPTPADNPSWLETALPLAMAAVALVCMALT